MKLKTLFLTASVLLNLFVGCDREKDFPADRDMTLFVGDLMKKMTLEEKIGQLNLSTGGGFFTGPAVIKDNKGLISQGKVGAILNTFGVESVAALQKMAVEEYAPWNSPDFRA